MAIRKYTQNAIERAMSGVTEWYVIKKADFVINATTTHTLGNLKAGDIVLPNFTLIVMKTLVAGPTATLTLGISGTVGQFIAATSIASGKAVVPQANATTMGAGSPTGALVAGEVNRMAAPYIVASDDTLVAQAVLSNTAITAGEAWIGVRILRRAVIDQILL